MQWYQYIQNNSGGSFQGPAHLVFIEANSASESDSIAQEHRIYFDGCAFDMDCECCGDRWGTADHPYYSVDSDLYSDKSLYLVAYGQPGVLTRTVDGALNPDAAALIDRARVEIDAQSAARKLAGR